MTVDFHTHSIASDGTFKPSELVTAATGYSALALTDHDNCNGLAEFLAAGRAAELPVVAGIELSIEPGEGFDKFHMLGLGIDPENPELKHFLLRVLEGRNERNKRIIANFLRLGIDLGDTVGAYAQGDILARPHFARWLVDHGYEPDVKAAFAKYLAYDAPPETSCYSDRWHPTQEDAMRVVHAAGGICVMAHPKFWCDDWYRTGCDYTRAERELARLKEVGLDGVETLYQANTPEENVTFTRIAAKLGYLMSAGSDFHGANKKNIPMGMEVADEFIAPLFARLGLK